MYRIMQVVTKAIATTKCKSEFGIESVLYARVGTKETNTTTKMEGKWIASFRLLLKQLQLQSGNSNPELSQFCVPGTE